MRERDFSSFTLLVKKTVSLVCLKFFPLRSLSLDHLLLFLSIVSHAKWSVGSQTKEITDVVPVKCMWSNPSQVTQGCSPSHIILCNTFVTEIAVSHTFKVDSLEKKRGREKCLTNEKIRERLRNSWNKKRPAEVMKMGFTRSGNNEREEWGKREKLDGLYFSFFSNPSSPREEPFFLRVEAVTLLLNSSTSQQENEWSLWQQTFTWRGTHKDT